MPNIKPMLAATSTEDLDALRYPLVASPKLDGIRCLIRDGVAMSRTLKPIPNRYIQAWAERWKYPLEGLDGELVVGPPNDPSTMRRTVSGVMSVEGEPEFTFFVFDHWGRGETSFSAFLAEPPALTGIPRAMLHEHETVERASHLADLETRVLLEGYEGLILRDPNSPYKHGRSTLKQGWMVKLKRFETNEAIVVGYEELMHNQNEAKINALGLTERSTHQENKVGGGVLGSLVVEFGGVQFNIGSGFTAAERQLLWAQKESLLGRAVTFKSFPIGVKEKPRHPVFVAFRSR